MQILLFYYTNVPTLTLFSLSKFLCSYVNKIINNLRITEKEQSEQDMKRLSKKLNESRNNLTSQLSMPCVMRGWIYKRTDHLYNWKRRYMVLENSVVRYYLTDKNIKPRGIFVLAPSSTVTREGDVIRIDNVKGTHDDGKTTLSARPFVFKLKEEDWALGTWALALEDNIDHSKNVSLPKNLKRLSSDTKS